MNDVLAHYVQCVSSLAKLHSFCEPLGCETNLKMKLDFFRKIGQDLTLHSRYSVFSSVITVLVMIYLVSYELSSYSNSAESMKSTVKMDTFQEDVLRIDFDISLYRIPCQYTSVDLTDHMGQTLVNVTRNVEEWKIQESEQGNVSVIEQVHLRKDNSFIMNDLEHKYVETLHLAENYITEIQTVAEFRDFMPKYQVVLVNYHVPWCPYCTRLAPVWDALAMELVAHPEYSEKVALAKVDCSNVESVRLCRFAHIHAFPSILVYVKGSIFTRYMYSGPRDVKSFLLFIDLFYNRFFAPKEDQLGVHDARTLDALHTAYDNDRPFGCRVRGSISIKRVPGKFQLTARAPDHTFDLSSMNLSHRVHSLSFGQPHDIEKYQSYPPYIATTSNLTIEHYIKVKLLLL